MSKPTADKQHDSGDDGKTSANSACQQAGDNLRAEVEDHPINLLLELATDDNVETHDGTELKVENVREAAGNALLTKTELQKYDEYKKQWASALERPQQSLDALAQREKQIIEAAANHDWEALDKLRSEVARDLERMQFIFSNIVTDMNDL
jgi:hypothetical protein